MTEEQLITRGNQAKRLLDDPIVIEALEIIERDVIEAIHDCPARDVDGLRFLQMELRRARKFKSILQGAIERGKLAAHELREKDTLGQRIRRML